MSFDLKAATTYPPGWLDQVLWAVRNAFCGQSCELSARFELSGAGYPPRNATEAAFPLAPPRQESVALLRLSISKKRSEERF